MNRDEVKSRIKVARVIAVIRGSDVENARELVCACVDGGIGVIEVTTSIPGWETLLRTVCEDCGDDAIVGLGTVTSDGDVARALDAGAEFVVSPYISQPVMEAADVNNITIIPGALTPTEVALAFELGAAMVKVFPVSSVGGPGYIKGLLAPMPDWELVPTGGVTPENAIDYFRAGAVAVGLGSNLVPKDKVKERDWDAVASAVSAFLESLNAQIEELTE